VALWELPELGEDIGVFWWWNHQNTPIYPLYHGDSQRPKKVGKVKPFKVFTISEKSDKISLGFAVADGRYEVFCG
jgi:hypothetical protein